MQSPHTPGCSLIATCIHTVTLPVTIVHCRLNRLSHTIYWKSPISILGTAGYEIYILLRKMAKLFANSGDPDQTPRSAASDLGLHCLSITLYGSTDYNGLAEDLRLDNWNARANPDIVLSCISWIYCGYLFTFVKVNK